MADAGRVRREGAEMKVRGPRDYLKLARQGIIEVDLAGIVLLGFAWSLILLPLNLSDDANGGWANDSMIAMLVTGLVILALFGAFEYYIAPNPFMNRRVLCNKAFLCALTVSVTNQMASSTKFVYFSSYIWIIKDWSEYLWNLFLNSTTLTLCFFGPVGGLIHRITHRYKSLMVAGAIIKFIGYAILLNGARSTQSTVALSFSQVFLGMGAFTVIGARVGSQASVPHEDLASVIALLSLWSTIGSSIGSTICAAIWQDKMKTYLQQELPNTSDETINKIYGSIKILRTQYDWQDPIRQGAITAYTRVNGLIFIAATTIAFVPVVGSMLMPDYYLGKQQNAVTNTGLDGEGVDVPTRGEPDTVKPGIWAKIKSAYYKEV
jgi:hypothetical protein